jgi:Holliday junction DNA helicase RuvA
MARHVNAECGTRQPVIGRLTGRVVSEDPDTVVLDVGGVGYELIVPLGTIGRATHDDGRVTLFVHTHVREDALALFGFASETDRVTFRTLIGISNVGPKTAITVLSVLPAEELARAITQGDLGKLTAVPGVGKKTAERLVLELKDKLKAKPIGSAHATAPSARKPSGQLEVLEDALVRMGYRPSEAERAALALGDRVEGQPMGQSVREALALLSK